ncbi:MAG: hypothetical protein ABSB41_16100 [Anaerolineales bacterium]|jgi:hypothetical protein
MIQGVHLTLMIGPGVPVPVPQVVLDSLTQVEVTTSSGRASGFQMQFTTDIHSPLQTILLLSGGSLPPLMRTILIATINGVPNVLLDGVITNVETSPGIDKGYTTLTITGEDLSAVMNWIDFSGFPFPAMPAEARVAVILAKYAFLGIVPLVIPSILLDVPIPVQEIPRQQGKDLEYIQSLADRVGYVFYLDPGPLPGMNVAYWGPEIRVGAPQPALNTNMDAYDNVESLSFTFDAEKKRLPVLMIQEPISKALIPIPIPDISPLNPPLGLIPPLPKHVDFISETADLNPIQAAVIGLTKAAKSADAIFASGSLDVTRYGRILKARSLVGVRGAGTAFDGLYYVTEVKHKIKRGEYKQDFKLVRNGLVSTLPVVPA